MINKLLESLEIITVECYHLLPGRTESRELKRDTQRLQMHAKQDTKENMRVFLSTGTNFYRVLIEKLGFLTRTLLLKI